MRLLESEVYRGRQIHVYVVYPGDLCRAPTPALGVRVDGAVLEGQAFLKNVTRLAEALDWCRRAVDRRLTGKGRAPG